MNLKLKEISKHSIGYVKVFQVWEGSSVYINLPKTGHIPTFDATEQQADFKPLTCESLQHSPAVMRLYFHVFRRQIHHRSVTDRHYHSKSLLTLPWDRNTQPLSIKIRYHM